MKMDLSDRLIVFAIRVFKLLNRIPNSSDIQVYKTQLIKSSSSSGANYEEAQGGSSKADFHNKINISLKEMRESTFFLQLIYRFVDIKELNDEFEFLIDESVQLKKILGSISAKTKRRIN